MNRQRVWTMFGIAMLGALLVSWMVNRSVNASKSRNAVKVVAAAHDLPVGHRIVDADLKSIEIPKADLPDGNIPNPADAVGRAVLFKLATNEAILESMLASKLGGEGLTAEIVPGMRAVSVQVNETVGVSGFVQPGSKVDVLFTRNLQNGDAAAATILQNVAVLAYGRNLQRPAPDAKQGPAPSNSTQLNVTLLVTQEDAEKLALAVQRGKIQLALRNPLDSKEEETAAVYSEDLGIVDPGIRRGNPPPARIVEVAPKPVLTVAPPKPKDPREGRIVIRVFRGNKVFEDVF